MVSSSHPKQVTTGRSNGFNGYNKIDGNAQAIASYRATPDLRLRGIVLPVMSENSSMSSVLAGPTQIMNRRTDADADTDTENSNIDPQLIDVLGGLEPYGQENESSILFRAERLADPTNPDDKYQRIVQLIDPEHLSTVPAHDLDEVNILYQWGFKAMEMKL